MALVSDWTIYKSNINLTATIKTTGVIGGSGSLLLSNNGIVDNPQMVLLRAREAERGISSAKMRTLMRLDSVSGMGCGFVFMMSQLDVTGTEGTFYGVFAGEPRVNGVPEIVLAKYHNGLKNAPLIILFSTAHTPVGVFALEIEWEVTLFGTLPAVHILVRRSDPSVDTVDFDHMTLIYEVTDSVLPAVITKAEGICYHDVFNGAGVITLDNSVMIRTV